MGSMYQHNSDSKYKPPTSPKPSQTERPVSWDERSSQASKKRGLLGKLKDKAIGTKEEREAEKARVQQLV